MMTHKELLELIGSLSIEGLDYDMKVKANKAASQIGFAIPDAQCKCKDKYNDLIIKLKIWAKQHQDECRYRMANGMVRRGPNGENIYQLNLTNESAEWILENDPEGAKYITKIADPEPEAEAVAEPAPKKKSYKKKTISKEA